MNQSNFFAYALILIGSVLLLDQFDLITLSRATLFIAGSLVLGILFLKKGLIHPQHKGIFGGSFWILAGLTLFLMQQNIFPTRDTFGFGMVFINLALANLVALVFNRKNVNNLSAALIFGIIGAAMVSVSLDLISGWRMADIFSVYWPVLLIIGGIFLLIEGLVKRTR